MDFLACLILELLSPVQTWCISFYLNISFMPSVVQIYMWRMSVMIHVLEVLCEWAGVCFSYDYGLVL